MSDANHLGAAHATAKVNLQKHKPMDAKTITELFESADEIGTVLGYLAGAASLCWSTVPKGTFESDQATRLVNAAEHRLKVLINEDYRQAIEAAVAKMKARRDAEAGPKPGELIPGGMGERYPIQDVNAYVAEKIHQGNPPAVGDL